MQKIDYSKIEFYITNVCNFNCDNCNRLNNYYFSGHQKWNEYADVYRQWSEKINFVKIAILGGEPTLNPDLKKWVAGLRQLWPNADIDIITNGSNLKYWHQQGLFDLLAKTHTNLQITLHNRDRRDKLIQEVESYLTDPATIIKPSAFANWASSYRNVKDPSWPECKTYDEFCTLPEYIKKECIKIHKIGLTDFLRDTGIIEITDSRNVKVTITHAEDFVTAPLRYAGNNQFVVYDSNPEDAHNVCISKNCTHMIKGKIYKCHHVGLLPEFDKQFNITMTNAQRNLMNQYRPLSVDDDDFTTKKFFNALPNAIPQCQLCPSELKTFHLKSDTNKPKIKKKIINIKPI